MTSTSPFGARVPFDRGPLNVTAATAKTATAATPNTIADSLLDDPSSRARRP